MITAIRKALIRRNATESWRYISQQTGIDASQLHGFATRKRTIGTDKLMLLADYLGLSLSRK